MITPEYKAYLKSPEWNDKRKKALFNAGYRCERCKKAKPLQVHHLTYERIFNERIEDLQALCFDCHKWVHCSAWQKIIILISKSWKRIKKTK